ncbi:MAG: hypothetical protein M9962_15125, partial [Oligoflexia bacterium]|nr:hypothetical protein [Oligoflexia bacterium]
IVFDISDNTYKGYGSASGIWYPLGGANAGPRSMVQVDSGNGYGSTNDKVRRFSNTRLDIGSDITYADSATNGASFTVNSDGVYSVTYIDRYTGGGEQICITVNATAMTTQCGTPITYAQGFRALGNALTNGAGNISWTGFLSAGDVVRPQNNGNANATDEYATFVVTKVSD